VASSSGPCPQCGKDPADHPSIAAAGFSSLDPFDQLETTGNDLSLDSGQHSPPSGGAQMSYDSGSLNEFGDEDDELSSGDSVHLELGGPQLEPPPQTPPAKPSPGAPAPDASPNTSADAISPTSVRARIVPASPVLDPYEIAVFADFGRPPEKIWLCPAYAIRVFTRTRLLRSTLRQSQANAADAERQRDDRLAALAERLKSKLEGDRELGGYLAPLARIEETARERERALSERSAEYSATVARIDQQIAEQETVVAELKKAQQAAAAEHETRSQVLTRAQAQLKRAEIELRNAQQVARAAAGPEARTAPPEHADAILKAQQVAEQRRNELQEPKAAADQSQRALAEADARVDEVDRRIGSLRSERRKFEATFSREMGVRSEGLEQALAEKRAALISIGARLFDTNSPVIPADDYESFGKMRADLSQRHLEVERLLRALDSADKNAVKKGWAVIGAGLAIVLILIVLTLSRLPG